MKKSFKKCVACMLIVAFVFSLPAFSIFASDSGKAEGWYFIERFNEKEFSAGAGNDIAFDPAADASTSGWTGYWRSSKTNYGEIVTRYDDETPYDKHIALNRARSSSTNATIYFGYYDVNGFVDDEFIVDMDVKIAPAPVENSGGYFRNTIELGSAFGWKSSVAYLVFTSDVVDDSGERINVVKYYDFATDTEIEIPELRGFKNDNWYSVRFEVNNTTNTYDLYVSDGKDAVLGEAVKSGIGFNEAIIKEVYITAYRNANDANGLFGGGVICLDNLKIGVETDAANLYRTGKSDAESINFENVAINSSLVTTPDENVPFEIKCGTSASPTRYGNVLIAGEGSNNMMSVVRGGKYAATVYASYPISDGISKNDGITTVQLRYKNVNIAKQFDRIQLFSATDINNGIYDYGAHLCFLKGDVYVADVSGNDFGADALPHFTKVAGAETMVANQWYTVKLVVNFNTMTYDVYLSTDVDGGKNPVVTGAPLYKEESDTYTVPGETKIRRIHFSTYYNVNNASLGGNSTFYIDDLLINPDLNVNLYDSINIDSSLIAEGTLSVNVPVNLITYNSTFEAEEIAHKMIVAVYDSKNALKAVDVNPGLFNGSSINKTITFDPSVYENGSVKVFLLDGFNSLLPLGSFETLS